ncbi:hypothetical protein K501DRAFT_241795 [Backusella circina FSU 941]|nr:hypothetical protein K501DRAFT_241795 [Backusella circina FSU 941]
MNNNNVLRPLHLRILFPQLLTLSKSDPRRYQAPQDITKSKSIDLELYTYFALLIRDFIHPWYRLVTNDQDACDEILSILTVLVQRLEKRLTDEVDWTELILIDLPKLLTLHYKDYRQAKHRLFMNHASGSASLGELFHGMQPHFALQPVEHREQEYLRLLTEAILKVLLDPKDCSSDCVRHLVREIVSNLVLYNLVEVLADPYTIHMIICKLLSSYEPMLDELEASGKFAETYFSALTNNSNNIPSTPITAAAKQKPAAAKPTNQESLTKQMQRLQEKRRLQGDEIEELDNEQTEATRRRFSFAYITLQVLLSPFRTLYYYLMATLTQSQERYQRVTQHKKRTRHMRLVESWMGFINEACLVENRPVLQWVWQMMAMFFWPLVRVFGGGLLIDKFLEQTVLHLLSEDHIVFYLRLGSDLLWPDGVFLQRAEPATPLQKEQMRVRAERLLTLSIPDNIRSVLFETSNLNELQTHIHYTIEPLQNKFINKHLLYLLVDLIVTKILPELLIHE